MIPVRIQSAIKQIFQTLFRIFVNSQQQRFSCPSHDWLLQTDFHQDNFAPVSVPTGLISFVSVQLSKSRPSQMKGVEGGSTARPPGGKIVLQSAKVTDLKVSLIAKFEQKIERQKKYLKIFIEF